MTPTEASVAVQSMILPFPTPGRQVQLAYRDLNIALNGSPEQKKQVGNPALLPRPWDPGSCRDAGLREEVWAWLEDVVGWVNHEYTWDVAATIPTCWPSHPHLVHEIAVVADQRRRASLAVTSDALEEWHRYCLPAFVDRLRTRLKAQCEDDHVPWPGRSRHNQYVSNGDTEQRAETYAADLRTLRRADPRALRLGLIDLDTGEVKEIDDDPDEQDD